MSDSLVPRVDALHMWSNLIITTLWGKDYYPSFTYKNIEALKG